MLSQLSVQRTIVSVAGITAKSCFNSNLLLVETEQAMMRSADEVIIVADSTKFGHQSLARMCELKDISKLVVDNEISENWRSKLRAYGVELFVAGEMENGERNMKMLSMDPPLPCMLPCFFSMPVKVSPVYWEP